MPRYVIDAGDGIEVHACLDELSPEARKALAALGRAVVATKFCEHFIEHPTDPWGGTYCKLLTGHEGAHSAHYPASTDSGQA